MLKLVHTLEQMYKLSEKFGSFLRPGDIIFLSGDIGAGKTTFTKGIGNAIKVKRVINSPTFTIVKQYEGEKYKLNHIDLYRIDKIEDFEIEDYINEDYITVIEWPKKEMLKQYPHIHVEIIDLGEEKRQLRFNSNVRMLTAVLGEL